MRARSPSTRVEHGRISVRTDLVAADGTELPPLVVSLPTAHADRLDPTATPLLPALATVAAARGEDLLVDAAVDPHMLAAARAVAARFAEQWGTDAVRVEAAGEAAAVGGGTGTGLFFTRGVDSTSTLLDLLEEPPERRVTTLLAVFHGPFASDAPLHEAIVDGHRRVARQLDLDLVTMETSIRALLDPFHEWIAVVGPALISAGLVASAGLARLVFSGSNRASVTIAGGSDPGLVAAVSTPAVEVVLGNPHRDRLERLAHIVAHPWARAHLQVCWQGETVRNCGRCTKCQSTRSGLILAGDPDPEAGFETPLDVEAVRAVRLSASDTSGLAQRLADELPPEHEELRRAWVDACARRDGVDPRPRWGDDAPPGLAGPGVPTRAAAALRTGAGTPERTPLGPLGWRPGAVPLRPAVADHRQVRARTAEGPDRDRAWAVVEHHIRDGRQDGEQAALALRALDAHGAGLVYLPGILWAPDQPPGLDDEAVGRLLATVRARLWWRPDGDLDPLRVVETVEHGCLPLQVMPAGPARALADDLPAPLAALVVADDELAGLDLSPAGVAARLAPAVDVLLAGSAEHGLVAGSFGG